MLLYFSSLVGITDNKQIKISRFKAEKLRSSTRLSLSNGNRLHCTKSSRSESDVKVQGLQILQP